MHYNISSTSDFNSLQFLAQPVMKLFVVIKGILSFLAVII